MGTQARRRREFAQPFSGFIQTIVSEEKEKSSLEFTCLAGHSFLEVTTDGHANSSMTCCQTIVMFLMCLKIKATICRTFSS